MKKHLQTKHNIFLVSVGDIKISDIFYKIQKVLRTSWAPIITTKGINFLMAGPFKRNIVSKVKKYHLDHLCNFIYFFLSVFLYLFTKFNFVTGSFTSPQ